MIDPFDRRKAAWAFDRRAQAEHTPAAIIATLQTYGFTGFHTEVYYGLMPQGQIDGLSPTTRDGFIAESLAFKNAGIAWVPVVVPRGLAGEAELHAVAAKAAGAIVVDMESDSSGSYWPWSQASQIRIYARALREACGDDVCIGWQPDGRLADPSRVSEWNQLVAPCAPYIDAWLPQLYAGWSAYGTGTAAIAADMQRYQRFVQLGPVYPTLYTAESLAEPTGLWAACMGAGATGFVAFRFGSMDGRALSMVRDLPLPASTPTPPTDHTQDLIAALTEARQRIDDALALLTM